MSHQRTLTPWFGRRVQRLRLARNWSLRKLAEESGVPFTSISRAENGQDLSLSSATALASALGQPLGDLVASPKCAACWDAPPIGFACLECGRGG